MASPGRKVHKATAIEFVRELLGRPDASEEEVMELARKAFAKVDGKLVSVTLEVNSAADDARLRKVLELLLKENDTKEGQK